MQDKKKAATVAAPPDSTRLASQRKKGNTLKSTKKLKASPRQSPRQSRAASPDAVDVSDKSAASAAAASGASDSQQVVDLSAEVARLLARTKLLEEENASLKGAVSAAQEDARGLRAECGALRGLVMQAGQASPAGPGAAAAGAAAASAAAASGEVDAQAARREAELLRQENARLARMLAGASGGEGRASVGVGASSSSATSLTTPTSLFHAASNAKLHRVVSDPAREKAVFLAAGFDTATRQYVTPDVAKLHEAIALGGVNINCRDGLGNPPLSHAAWLGAEALIAELIMHGADLDAENLDGATPLHYCVFNDQVEAAALLISAGADPSAADADAGSMGKPEIVALIRAACDGKPHSMLKAAEAKFERLCARDQ